MAVSLIELVAAQKRSERIFSRKRDSFILNQLYGPAGVKPGDKPDWFPMTDGVPTPEEFVKLMDKGGFGGEGHGGVGAASHAGRWWLR